MEFWGNQGYNVAQNQKTCNKGTSKQLGKVHFVLIEPEAASCFQDFEIEQSEGYFTWELFTSFSLLKFRLIE